MPFPRRVVCLSTESAELAFALGCEDQVAGVTGFAVRPAAVRKKPRVSAFSTADVDKILALKPDLVIGFSDVQRNIAAELIRRGVNTLITNQRTLPEVYDAIRLIARVLDRGSEGERLAGRLEAEFAELRERAAMLPSRPRVFFEEWDDPLISGIGWVSDIIECCGGTDVFRDRGGPAVTDRVVEPAEVIDRDPDVIFASWCGKKANLQRIAARPGWEQVAAVRNNRIEEIKSVDILQPGLSLIVGARQMAAHIAEAAYPAGGAFQEPGSIPK